MPRPTEICEVRAKGSSFRAWKSVDVEVCIGTEPVVAQATLVVAEIGNFKSWSTLRLKPGDPVQVYMAGQQAIDGVVTIRQVTYDAGSHNVRIVIQSKLGDTLVSSAKPEQQKNVTLTQACNHILKSGNKFSLLGSPKDADKIFKSVVTHVGETKFQACVRLAAMRNIHLMDDRKGNLVGVRNDGSEKSVGQLREGSNIKSAEMIWRWDTAVDLIKSNTQQQGNNETWADPARNPGAQSKNPNFNGQRTVLFVTEHPGDIKDAQLRADHEVDLNIATMFDAQVTVLGWLNGGKLWLEYVHQLIDVYSPMLFPSNRETLGIYKVNCKQGDDIGTITTLGLCLKNWLGHGGPNLIQSGDGQSPGGQANADNATPLPDFGAKGIGHA
jgi:prophage tail gpP-like protein